jgi:hypothetical protein
MVRYEYLKNFVRFSEKISKDFKCFANTSFYESAKFKGKIVVKTFCERLSLSWLNLE